MDDWASCAPETSHYSAFNDPGHLRIRKICAVKKPTEFAVALAGATTADNSTLSAAANATLLASGTVVTGTPARKLLRA